MTKEAANHFEGAKIPDCIELKSNGTCSLKATRASTSDDGTAIKIEFCDAKKQIFPIAMSEQDLCDLLFVVGVMSQKMAEKKKELGQEPSIHVIRGRGGEDLPPIYLAISWSPDTQKARFVIGNVGLEFPMDADTAKTIGEDLVAKTSPYATGQTGTKH